MSRAARIQRVAGWLARKLAGAVIVVWAVATLAFLAVRAIPGDPVLAVLGGPASNASPEAIAATRVEYGFDQPIWTQYAVMLGRLATGDLGRSAAHRQPVADLIAAQLPGTLTLAALGLAAAWLLALAALVSAELGGSIARSVCGILEMIAATLPHFWLGAVLIAVVAVGARIPMAVSDRGPAGLILPVLTLAVPLAGFLAQTMRARADEVREAPFVTAARMRGDGRFRILRRHLLRHAATPAVHLSSWAFGTLVSGAIVVETVFARPGLGRTLAQAVIDRDVPLVIGSLVVSAVVYAVLTVVTDAVAALIDPREVNRG